MLNDNIQQLVDFINVRRTYEEVEQMAQVIDPLWRSETWRRSLRRRSDIRAIGKDGQDPNGHNVIVAYEPVKFRLIKEQPTHSQAKPTQERLFKPRQISY